MRVDLELLDQSRQMGRDGSHGGVVLLLKALPYGSERDTPQKSGIDLHVSGTGNDGPMCPVIYPVGSDREIAHWARPRSPPPTSGQKLNGRAIGCVPRVLSPPAFRQAAIASSRLSA